MFVSLDVVDYNGLDQVDLLFKQANKNGIMLRYVICSTVNSVSILIQFATVKKQMNMMKDQEWVLVLKLKYVVGILQGVV